MRPPGSVPEDLFLDLCIRCAQCFKVWPGPVLHSARLEYGWESLWTPVANLDHGGCHQDCNFCTLVCPTGAIQPLEIAAKRRFHMGLARVDPETRYRDPAGSASAGRDVFRIGTARDVAHSSLVCESRGLRRLWHLSIPLPYPVRGPAADPGPVRDSRIRGARTPVIIRPARRHERIE